MFEARFALAACYKELLYEVENEFPSLQAIFSLIKLNEFAHAPVLVLEQKGSTSHFRPFFGVMIWLLQ